MNIRVAIAGLPNTGSTSLVNLIDRTRALPVDNSFFTTMRPQLSTAPLRNHDAEFIAKSLLGDTAEINFTSVTLVDGPGIVPTSLESGQSEVLGDVLPMHEAMRSADAVLYLVRGYASPRVPQYWGRVDPLAELRALLAELAARDVLRVHQLISRHGRSGSKSAEGREEVEVLIRCLAHMTAAVDAQQLREAALHGQMHLWLRQHRPVECIPLSAGSWRAEEQRVMRSSGLLSCKPGLCVVNVSAWPFLLRTHSSVLEIAEYLQSSGIQMRVEMVSVELENRLGAHPSAEPSGGNSFLPLLPSLLLATVRCIEFMHLPLNSAQVNVYLVQTGASVLEACRLVSEDVYLGLICCEVMSSADLRHYGSRDAVRLSGRLRQVGKQYKVASGDVLHFVYRGRDSGGNKGAVLRC